MHAVYSTVGDLVDPPSQLPQGWVITPHINKCTWLLIHTLVADNLCQWTWYEDFRCDGSIGPLHQWHWSKSWWRHQMETFSALLVLCAGNSPVPVNSPHKGQWCGALMFSLICHRIDDWVNNREAGDLRRHRGHYDVIVMCWNMAILTDAIHNRTQQVIILLKWISNHMQSKMYDEITYPQLKLFCDPFRLQR